MRKSLTIDKGSGPYGGHAHKVENVLKRRFKTPVLKHVFFCFFLKNTFFITEGVFH